MLSSATETTGVQRHRDAQMVYETSVDDALILDMDFKVWLCPLWLEYEAQTHMGIFHIWRSCLHG